jgi:hypothetical protein
MHTRIECTKVAVPSNENVHSYVQKIPIGNIRVKRVAGRGGQGKEKKKKGKRAVGTKREGTKTRTRRRKIRANAPVCRCQLTVI